MGLSILEKKNKAMRAMRKFIPVQHYYTVYDMTDIAAKAIDLYVETNEAKKCKRSECDNIVSARNKSGLCRSCYRSMWRKRKHALELDASRARKYRKGRKLNILKS